MSPPPTHTPTHTCACIRHGTFLSQAPLALAPCQQGPLLNALPLPPPAQLQPSCAALAFCICCKNPSPFPRPCICLYRCYNDDGDIDVRGTTWTEQALYRRMPATSIGGLVYGTPSVGSAGFGLLVSSSSLVTGSSVGATGGAGGPGAGAAASLGNAGGVTSATFGPVNDMLRRGQHPLEVMGVAHLLPRIHAALAKLLAAWHPLYGTNMVYGTGDPNWKDKAAGGKQGFGRCTSLLDLMSLFMYRCGGGGVREKYGIVFLIAVQVPRERMHAGRRGRQSRRPRFVVKRFCIKWSECFRFDLFPC